MTSLDAFSLHRDLPTATLVSHSNHKVYQWRDLFIKVASEEYPKAEGLRNEAKVVAALGRPHQFLEGRVLVTHNLGSPVTKEAFTSSTLTALIEAAKEIHALPKDLPLEVVTRRDLLAHRIAKTQHTVLHKLAQPWWEKLLTLAGELPASTLVHGDLHLSNVVMCDSKLSLVDLESAHYSVPEWDWATFWIALSLENFPHRYLDLLAKEVDDEELFMRALYTKLAMVMTWSVAKNDEAGLVKRLELAQHILQM